ncbi:MAG: hypothetical protein M3Y87_20665 [Myxococcota bacterium]|nr:hypothetical protein [Myxococcota bacterium]
MRRRHFVSASIVALLAPALPARADLVAPPPPPIDVSARPTVHTGRSGAPSSASWELRNTGATPIHVRLGRAVCLFEGMRLPLRVVGARVDGRDARELDLGPRRSATIEVLLDGFSDPAAREGAWTVELSVEVSGGEHHSGHARGVTTVRRVPLPG